MLHTTFGNDWQNPWEDVNGQNTHDDANRKTQRKNNEGTVNINSDYNFNFNHCKHSHYFGVCLKFITRNWRVLSSHVSWSIGDSNPYFIFLLQFYKSHFATRIICILCNITIILRLYFPINDDWGDSIFSWKGQSGQIKKIHSFCRCCEYLSGGIIPLPYV